jgi:hypothetical protein
MKMARFRIGSGLAVAAIAVLAPLASAQPPRVQDLGSGSVILPYLIGIILAAAAVGLAAMPSRREHQD